MADDGEDLGRLVEPSTTHARTSSRALATDDPARTERVAHAIRLFRERHADVNRKRSAIVALAGVLRGTQGAPQEGAVLEGREAALFQIANEFDLRHRTDSQQGDYDPVFLDWVFWWYLATVELTDRLLDRQGQKP